MFTSVIGMAQSLVTIAATVGIGKNTVTRGFFSIIYSNYYSYPDHLDLRNENNYSQTRQKKTFLTFTSCNTMSQQSQAFEFFLRGEGGEAGYIIM
jgi:hypothetical protein